MNHAEIRRINELNAAYMYLLRHLAWEDNKELLRQLCDFDEECTQTLTRISEEQLQHIYEGRPSLVFRLEANEAALEQIAQAQSELKNKAFSQLFSDNSAYLKVSQCPVGTLVHLVLREIKSWSATSTNTAYRFGCSPKLLSLIERTDENTLVKFASSMSITVRQRFTTPHLHATGLTGLIPVSLMYC